MPLTREKRASSIKPNITKDSGEKYKGEVEDLRCRVGGCVSFPLCSMNSVHVSHAPHHLHGYRPAISFNSLIRCAISMEHCWHQVQNVQHFPAHSCLVNRNYKPEAQKAPQGLWALARFLPLELSFRAWNMCHFPQPRLMQHKGLLFFKMLVLLLTYLSLMITTFLPAELPITTYTYQLISL